MTLAPRLIFIASFVNKNAAWKISKFDLLCGSLSLVGLVLWIITKIGNLAIVFSILGDIFAAIPTVTKSFYHPETESSGAYLASTIAALIAILTITTWNFATYGFPLYALIINLLIYLLVQLKLGKSILIK